MFFGNNCLPSVVVSKNVSIPTLKYQRRSYNHIRETRMAMKLKEV